VIRGVYVSLRNLDPALEVSINLDRVVILPG
jgi:hypothetical protein